MKEYEVPFWAALIITNMEISAGNLWWALPWISMAGFLLFVGWKNGKV